mmetsp:Transcript_46482/g.92079  ORF Transcript_46482/g.92079 Transcript_46482/m.92079 type:complete len:210 (-) Transcript_46482:108-737(-)
MTYVPQFSAHSTAVRTSSAVNCTVWRGSSGLAAPPPTATLSCVAPYLKFSLQACSIAGLPSTMKAMSLRLMASPQRHGQLPSQVVTLRRKSKWPPVCDIIRQQGKMRGPAITPSAQRLAMLPSAPPASLMVVKPRRSILSKFLVARIPISQFDIVSSWVIFMHNMTCVWMSMKPGVMTLPPQSISLSPFGATSAAPCTTRSIFEPRTRM